MHLQRRGRQHQPLDQADCALSSAAVVERLKGDMLDVIRAAPLDAENKKSESYAELLARVEEAPTLPRLGELLLDFAMLLPRAQLKDGFKPWWPAEGERESTQMQLETAHQVFLRLHLIDAALTFGR